MSRHTQGSLAIVGMIAGGIFLVAFVALLVVGDAGFNPSWFFAALVSLVAAIVLYRGFQTAPSAPAMRAPVMPAAAPAPAPAPAAVSEPEPAAEPVAEAASEEQSKPELLDGPREGGADDLKKIKGVGPKMEEMLNGMGIYHYSQVASWGPSEVAWVDDNLEGFKGRVSRDNWVEQAKTLAGGGETDFSKRVDDGDVY
ncbi:NADH:ubiquinone oxidoreductase [Alphaproteobacteria bacterium GH1-50]|uniref:NADH:ubiquinone oxidoreductase n=1 Tax=Kangsaoukella pontilimi TaxID=2691042 RepID=A0A7C9IP17_9RHOB|nr:NADH:ubiquinone oxidoreductase [Kangsaoukella pontilimi]MXQ07770.1 NADH:ubiquinone oxidoreductase [Kangsaoukella pontilimi]